MNLKSFIKKQKKNNRKKQVARLLSEHFKHIMSSGGVAKFIQVKYANGIKICVNQHEFKRIQKVLKVVLDNYRGLVRDKEIQMRMADDIKTMFRITSKTFNTDLLASCEPVIDEKKIKLYLNDKPVFFEIKGILQ